MFSLLLFSIIGLCYRLFLFSCVCSLSSELFVLFSCFSWNLFLSSLIFSNLFSLSQASIFSSLSRSLLAFCSSYKFLFSSINSTVNLHKAHICTSFCYPSICFFLACSLSFLCCCSFALFSFSSLINLLSLSSISTIFPALILTSCTLEIVVIFSKFFSLFLIFQSSFLAFSNSSFLCCQTPVLSLWQGVDFTFPPCNKTTSTL